MVISNVNPYIYIYMGDFRERLAKVEDGSVDLILTDIPYNISKDSNFTSMGRQGIDFGEWDKGFNERQLDMLIPKLSDNGSIVSFMAFEQYNPLIDTFADGMELKDRMIFEKTNPMPRNRDRRYVCNIELCVWFTKKGANWTFNRQNDNYDACVMRYPIEMEGRFHPCQKNLNLMEELVARHSNPGDLVLDPFMGSGTTGVACRRLGRKFVGIEADKNYFNLARQRLESETSQMRLTDFMEV